MYLCNKVVSQVYTVTSKDFSKTDLNWLIKNSKLTSRNKYVCNICLDYAKDKRKENDTYIEKDELATVNNEECSEMTEESTDNKNETISSDIKSVIDRLNNGKITEFECNELFEAMGNFLNMDVYNQSKLMMNNAEYKKFTEIPSIELYLKKFNYSLVNFLICLTKDKKGMVNKQLNQIAMTIEQILATRNAKSIGPLSFSQGLVKWSLSGKSFPKTEFLQLVVVLQHFEAF